MTEVPKLQIFPVHGNSRASFTLHRPLPIRPPTVSDTGTICAT